MTQTEKKIFKNTTPFFQFRGFFCFETTYFLFLQFMFAFPEGCFVLSLVDIGQALEEKFKSKKLAGGRTNRRRTKCNQNSSLELSSGRLKKGRSFPRFLKKFFCKQIMCHFKITGNCKKWYSVNSNYFPKTGKSQH